MVLQLALWNPEHSEWQQKINAEISIFFHVISLVSLYILKNSQNIEIEVIMFLIFVISFVGKHCKPL